MKQHFSLIFLLPLIVLSAFSVPNEGTCSINCMPKASQQNDVAQITFVATVADNIERLEIQFLRLIDAYSYDTYEMTKDSQNPFVFNITLELPKGGLIRYRYAIQGNEWEYLADKNPSFRVLIVPEINAEVHDSIAGFCPSFNPASKIRLNITGRIIDEGGNPVNNGFIVIGGVIAPLTANGSFLLQNVFAGNQRIVVFPYDYKPVQIEQTLDTDNDSTPNEITLDTIITEKVAKIRLTFLVKAPEGTPVDKLKIVGDLPILGYVHPYMVSSKHIKLQHLQDNWFITTIEVSQYIPFNYYYTIGTYSVNYEIKLPYTSPKVRSIVPSNNSIIVDEIEAWKTTGYSHMTFKVSVPVNTPAEYGVFMVTGNSFIEMDQINATLWTREIDYPTGWSFNYFYTVGQVNHAIWERDYNSSHFRAVIADDAAFYDKVEKWNYLEAAQSTTEETVNVMLTITVPLYTPNETLYLAGEMFDGWINPQGKPLQRLDAHSYQVSVIVERNQPATFTITRGTWTTMATKNFTITPNYSNEKFNIAIDGWQDLVPNWNRSSLMVGVMPIDYWSSEMRTTLEPSFKHFAEMGGKWIEYSVVWNFDRLKPTMFLSSSTGVYTSDEDLVYIVETAQKYGLKVGLQLQFNREMTTDASQWGNFSADEIDILLENLRTFYLHYGKLAQQLGIEFLAFARVTSDWLKVSYDTFMQELIPEIRKVYPGLLTTHQGWTDDFQFYSLLDFIGLYFWEPILENNADPTVDELTVAFENIIDDHYLPLYNKYHKPVLFTQVAYAAIQNASGQPPIPSIFDGETTIEYRPDIQAKIYEALFRAIANRTWIEGLFSFGWKYWPAEFPDYSISYSIAEAVLTKWTNMIPYSEGVDINNSNPVYIKKENFILPLCESNYYTEIRLQIQNSGNWSDWIPYQTELNITNVLPEINTEQQYTVWLQAQNSSLTSNPIAVKFAVDIQKPKIIIEPSNKNYNLSNVSSINRVIMETDTSLPIWAFEDTSVTNIDARIIGNENYSINFTGKVLVLPITLFSEGKWNVELTIYDEYNHTSYLTFNFSTYTTVPPNFISIPNDLIFEEGTTGHTLSWVANDTNPAFYVIYINGTQVVRDNWLSNQQIRFTVDNLTVGKYNITIVVVDKIGLSATNTVWVTVISNELTSTSTITSNDDTFTTQMSSNTSKTSFPIITILALFVNLGMLAKIRKYTK